MTNLEILMMDGCTKSKAERHLKRGTIVFESEDFEKHFENYMDEWDANEEERKEYKQMIDEKNPATDWGIVEKKQKTWYIMYNL